MRREFYLGREFCLGRCFVQEGRASWAFTAVLLLFLLLLLALPPGMLLAQNAAETAPNAISSATPDPAPNAASQKSETQSSEAAPGVPLPAAMATRSKVPSASDYDEVHIQPTVKTADKARFDPNSPTAAEAAMDPGLQTHTKPLRVDVDLVLVPVTITDPSERPVLGLAKENFIVLDNGEKQQIEHFSCEDSPISLGVIFDLSGSMANKIGKAREAVGEFLKTANPEDEFFLIAFNDKPTLIHDFTTSVESVQQHLLYTVPKGRTALLDAIYLGVAKMRQAGHRRKALLIISDGADNRSRYTENEIKAIVKEADVQIYAIGIYDVNPRSEEERFGPALLSEVSEVTGGRAYPVGNLSELSETAARIGLELRNQYVLGYRPSKPARDGKWRKVRVKLTATKDLPPLTVYAKMGYYAPGE